MLWEGTAIHLGWKKFLLCTTYCPALPCLIEYKGYHILLAFIIIFNNVSG